MPSSKQKKGLILAAGFGSRLQGVSPVTAFKPLTPVAGKPLIFRTIESLERAGCTSVVIVLGHGHEEVKTAILDYYKGETPLEFVYNDQFELSNGVSVLSAKDHLSDIFIMTMADHVLGESLMKIAGEYSPKADSAALLVDYKIESIFDMDDATKVVSENQKIVSIGKQIKEFNCIDTGVFVCTQGLLKSLANHYKKFGDASISDGVQDLAKKGRMYTIDIEDGFWQDVDTPEMLEYVEKILSN
ncbi:MAG: NTP transferase domain-containing protein [Balneolaceae bacterium]